MDNFVVSDHENAVQSKQSKEIDLVKIFNKCHTAAEAGDAKAMLKLGNLYANGTGVKKDRQKALAWYQKAAQAGNTDAKIKAEKILVKLRAKENKKILKQRQKVAAEAAKTATDEAKATAKAIKAAAEAGNVKAMLKLGNMYANGAEANKNYNEALAWYKKAADKGNVPAMNALGKLYSEGKKGIPKDYSAAAVWYKNAADNGDVAAMSVLGKMYSEGKNSIPQDYCEAVAWYKKAADAGNVNAMVELGNLIAEGKGVQQNFDVALLWYEAAANHGNTNGAILLGEQYEKGNNVPQNYEKAGLLYQQAAKAGNAVAMRNIIRLFDEGKYTALSKEIALQWVQRAANKGDAMAMKILADKYFRGEWGLFKNLDDGKKWLSKAIKVADTNMRIKIAKWIVVDGKKLGLSIQDRCNYAKPCFSEAAQHSNTEGMILLGDLYRKTYIEDAYEDGFVCRISLQDDLKAVEWYRKAAALGAISAVTRLGICHIYGWGMPKQDVEEGMKCLQMAANAGDTDAMRFMGRMYYDGIGVTQDKVKSLGWYRRAAEAGSIWAKEKINQLNNEATKKGGCFITTAVCGSLHKPDDCYELTMFRSFRDGWLQSQPDGSTLIAEYYEVAPGIVRAIDALPDANTIYRSIWDKYLSPCLAMLEAKNMRGCKEAYKKMVLDMKKRFA